MKYEDDIYEILSVFDINLKTKVFSLFLKFGGEGAHSSGVFNLTLTKKIKTKYQEKNYSQLHLLLYKKIKCTSFFNVKTVRSI